MGGGIEGKVMQILILNSNFKRSLYSTECDVHY